MLKEFDYQTSTVRRKDMAPAGFMFFAILGSAAVAFSKYLNWPAWAIISIPLVVIGGYGLAASTLPRIELRRDQIGDNLYYLGFLLTLVSLTITLVQYSSNANEDYIVTNFGLALVATIAGIFGRTILNQMRKDVVGIEREVQASLSEASLRLRGQMSASLESFASFQRHMAQVTEESTAVIASAHEQLAAGLVNIVDEQTKALQEASERNAKVLNEAIEASTSSIVNGAENHVKSLHRSSNALAETVNRNAATIDSRISSFLEEMEAKNEGVLNRIDDQKEVVSNGFLKLESAAKQFEQISFDPAPLKNFEIEYTRSFRELSSQLSKLGKASDHELVALVDTVRSLVDEMKRLQAELKTVDAFALTRNSGAASISGASEENAASLVEQNYRDSQGDVDSAPPFDDRQPASDSAIGRNFLDEGGSSAPTGENTPEDRGERSGVRSAGDFRTFKPSSFDGS